MQKETFAMAVYIHLSTDGFLSEAQYPFRNVLSIDNPDDGNSSRLLLRFTSKRRLLEDIVPGIENA